MKERAVITAATTRRRRRAGGSDASVDEEDTSSTSKVVGNAEHIGRSTEFHIKKKAYLRVWNDIQSSLLPSKKTPVFRSFLMIVAVLSVISNLERKMPTVPLRRIQEDLDAISVAFPYGYRDDVRPFLNLRVFKPQNYHQEPDLGGLSIFSLAEEELFSRRIDPWSLERHEHENFEYLQEIDDPYFNPKYQADEDMADQESQCQRTNWRSQKFPNCNAFHEVTLGRPPAPNEDLEIKYLGSGHFRNAWLYKSSTSDFVYKRLKLNDEFGMDYFDMYKIHREAIVLERLTHSPRIIDIYGFCSTTILAETMASEVWHDIIPGTGHARQIDLDRLDDVYPRNQFTPTEKLEMSLEMAEALADIHGFDGGVILHGDTHPEQWLRAKDGTLKLNDFNNAEILDFDEENNHYCKEWRRYGGFYRAPEEYPGMYIDEEVDTFSLGNNIYCLLTGLWPFYEWSDYTTIQRKLLNRERAYVDPRWRQRSYAESKMIDIMEETWEFDPDERISIFEVVKFLREAVEENRRRLNKEAAKNTQNNKSHRELHYKTHHRHH